MLTKHLHTALARIDKFDDDIEAIDVLRRSVLAGDLTDATGDNVLSRVDPETHTHLVRRRNSDHSRLLVMNHLRKTIYSAYAKDLYEETTHYLRGILGMAALVGFDSGRLIGEHSAKMDARSLLKLGSWEAVCQEVSASVFQSLEAERSTPQLLRKIRTKLSLNVDEVLINNALPYLEARHLLVHADGAVNDDYRAKYPGIPESNEKLWLNYQFVRTMRSAVLNLLQSFDAEVIAKNLVPEGHMHMAPNPA